VSTKTERVTVEWVDRSGIWYIAAIAGGPLPLLALPKAAGEPEAGPLRSRHRQGAIGGRPDGTGAFEPDHLRSQEVPVL
jgi:hypothetical protein